MDLISEWYIGEEEYGNLTQTLLMNKTYSELEQHFYDIGGEQQHFCSADESCPTCPRGFGPPDGMSDCIFSPSSNLFISFPKEISRLNNIVGLLNLLVNAIM